MTWVIRRFIDPNATIRFVEPEEVAEVQRHEIAEGFDAPERAEQMKVKR